MSQPESSTGGTYRSTPKRRLRLADANAPACAALAIPVLLALTVRLGYLWTIGERPEILVPSPGLAEDLYRGLARRVAAGDLILGEDVYWFSPLYAYLLGALHALFGDSHWVARGLNVVLGTGAVVPIYLAVLASFRSRAVATVSALIAAFYGPRVLFDTSAMKTSLGLFLVALTLWSVQRGRERASARPWLFAGIAAGAMLNLIEGLGLFPVFLIAWLLAAGPGMAGAPPMPMKGRAVRVGLLSLGLLLAITPFTARNLLVAGELVPISAKAGIHLYIGNRQSAWGGYLAVPGVRPNSAGHWFDARRIAERALGHTASASDVSDYWTGRTLNQVRADPVHFLSLLWRKLLLSFNAYEIAQTYNWQYEERRSKLLASLPRAGLLLPLALAGLLMAVRNRRDLAPWYLLFLASLAGLVLTIVNWRYRMPLMLASVPFAAYCLCGCTPGFGMALGRDSPSERASSPRESRLPTCHGWNRTSGNGSSLRQSATLGLAEPSIIC